MAKLQSRQLDKLLFQAQKYTPASQLDIQINACETLLRLIRPDTEYPFEFVCFHLTGYRPKQKQTATSDLIHYSVLLADLPRYAESLSRVHPQSATLANQKVYTVEALSKRFRVCAKTVRRWRQRGLTGRYMRFQDGRLRLGFLASSVDYFVRQNRQKISRSKSFSLISESELQAIHHRLERWAHFCPDHRQQALVRTARKFGRSFETVRRILLDLESQTGPLFQRRAETLTAKEQKSIVDLYQQGHSVQTLTQRFDRSRSNIYWAINQSRLVGTTDISIEFIHSNEFDHADNPNLLLTPPAGLFEKNVHSQLLAKPKASSTVKDSKARPTQPLGSLEAYVSEIQRAQLLTPKQESFLFCKFNFLKYQAKNIQQRIQKKLVSRGSLRELQIKLKQSEVIKHILIQSNLRLVVSTARKHTRNPSEMLEFISEGNVALINAVEKFDYSRGFKFSTYATWAIVKRFASYHTKLKQQKERLNTEELVEVAINLRLAESKVMAVESARKSLRDIMNEALEERERVIVREHYGLGDQPELPLQRKAKSFNQIGKLVGLSKERVRQIELIALQKLRRVLSGEQFELLLNPT